MYNIYIYIHMYIWVWLKIKQEGQTAGFGSMFPLTRATHFGTGFWSHIHIHIYIYIMDIYPFFSGDLRFSVRTEAPRPEASPRARGPPASSPAALGAEPTCSVVFF